VQHPPQPGAEEKLVSRNRWNAKAVADQIRRP
jgi:hypothetical protein